MRQQQLQDRGTVFRGAVQLGSYVGPEVAGDAADANSHIVDLDFHANQQDFRRHAATAGPAEWKGGGIGPPAGRRGDIDGSGAGYQAPIMRLYVR